MIKNRVLMSRPSACLGLILLGLLLLWLIFWLLPRPQPAPVVPTVRPSLVPTITPTPSATATPSRTPPPTATATATPSPSPTTRPTQTIPPGTPAPDLPPLPGPVELVLGESPFGAGIPTTLGRFGGLYDNQRLIAAGHIMLTVPGEADLPIFHIDAYEVTNQQMVLYINQSGLTDIPLNGWSGVGWLAEDDAPLRQTAAGTWEIRAPEWAALPVHGVSGLTARAYCANLGGRLPTLAEWERAAYWQPDAPPRPYPWGAAPLDRTRANFATDGPAPRDAYDSGRSWIGAYHLLGNVAEWVRLPGGEFALMGGSFAQHAADFTATAQRPQVTDPSQAPLGVGLRCVRLDAP